MIPSFLLLRLFVLGYSICASETISLTSEGTDSGSWINQSSVKLVCTMSPYTGILKWRFNSSDVAECTFNNCRQIATGDGAFMFGFDTANGVFAWVISPVDIKKHDRQVFECNDGTDTANVTAIVTDPDVSTKDAVNSCTNVSLAGVYISIWIAFIFSCIFTWIVIFLLKRALEKKVTYLETSIKADLEKKVTYLETSIKADLKKKVTSLEISIKADLKKNFIDLETSIKADLKKKATVTDFETSITEVKKARRPSV